MASAPSASPAARRASARESSVSTTLSELQLPPPELPQLLPLLPMPLLPLLAAAAGADAWGAATAGAAAAALLAGLEAFGFAPFAALFGRLLDWAVAADVFFPLLLLLLVAPLLAVPLPSGMPRAAGRGR